MDADLEVPSDARFLVVAQKRLGRLFPRLPQQPGYWKRRDRLTDVIEALTAKLSSGFYKRHADRELRGAVTAPFQGDTRDKPMSRRRDAATGDLPAPPPLLTLDNRSYVNH
jgi:hypothetical protein